MKPWIPLEDLLQKPIPERVKYVRENIRPDNERRFLKGLTQDEFAGLIGLQSGRQGVIRWESDGNAPRDFAAAIAKLTPYPPTAFVRDLKTKRALEHEVQSLRVDLQSLEERVFELAAAVHVDLAKGSGGSRQAQHQSPQDE